MTFQVIQVILAVIIFLLGFYCGKIWVTKLAGKTISFSLRGALTVLFLILVVIALIVTLIFAVRTRPSNESNPTTEQVAPPPRN